MIFTFMKPFLIMVMLFAYSFVFGSEVAAQVGGQEISYMMTTFVLLFSSVLVMLMAAGFCMLESGMVSSKSVSVICLKNLVLYSLACLCYYLIGYNLMFENVGSWMGSLHPLIAMKSFEAAFLAGGDKLSTLPHVLSLGSFSLAGALFQTVFVATAASVVSGALAERVKLWPFLFFVVVLSAIIYPVVGAWTWGNGWLGQMGFKDFAGSTVVHSVGGWASLSGALFLGARAGKYRDGRVIPTPPSNVPLVTLGVFILWFGWFGFNGGSVLNYSSAIDAASMSTVFFNTNIAAVGGTLSALALSILVYKRLKMLVILNGAISGLVSITAGPDISSPLLALFIGSVGGVLAALFIPILDRFKVDDVVGAIPAHLVCGIWGTLAVGIFTEVSFVTQAIGVFSIGAFVFVTTALVWWLLKKVVGIRITEGDEFLGQDVSELEIEAYPEFFNIDNMQVSKKN